MTRYALYTVRYMLVVLLTLTGCAKEPPIDISVNAKCAIIVEAKNGRVLFEKNSEDKFPPASPTKVMTAIVAIEQVPLEKKITPTRNATRVEPTVAGLKEGVKYTVRDLIAAMLIKSANDAAVTVAEGIGGSKEQFIRLMNVRAKKLGMKDTYFATASGLPTGKKDKQYTTAKDLAVMMRYALKHKVLYEAMSQKGADIYGSDGRKIRLKTHNRSLYREGKEAWGKTGYTREAKRTFTGTDPSSKPRIVFALLQSDNLWHDIGELKDGGLQLYERRHRNFLKDLFKWIKKERAIGREK